MTADPTSANAGTAPAAVNPQDDPGDIFAALREQLGLKLVSERGPVQMLVIKHAEGPSGN